MLKVIARSKSFDVHWVRDVFLLHDLAYRYPLRVTFKTGPLLPSRIFDHNFWVLLPSENRQAVEGARGLS